MRNLLYAIFILFMAVVSIGSIYSGVTLITQHSLSGFPFVCLGMLGVVCTVIMIVAPMRSK